MVSVKAGYARNSLIPTGKAIIANAANRKRLQHLRDLDDAREGQRLNEYKEIVEKLKEQSLRIPMKAGANGKIFGSVTSVQIAQALREQFNVDLERRKIGRRGGDQDPRQLRRQAQLAQRSARGDRL